jgi:hypothetical protein
MYYIIYNNNEIFKNIDLYDVIIELNIIISKLYSEKHVLNIIDHNDNKTLINISYTTNLINVVSDHEIKLSYDYSYLIVFFIFTDVKILSLDSNVIENIIKLNPNSILDIIMYNNSLLDPIYVLLKIFNIDENALCQVFILYLNKSLLSIQENSPFNQKNIIFSFTQSKFIDLQKYQNLLMYYIGTKKLIPIRLKCIKYVSKFDQLNL